MRVARPSGLHATLPRGAKKALKENKNKHVLTIYPWVWGPRPCARTLVFIYIHLYMFVVFAVASNKRTYVSRCLAKMPRR